MSERYQVEEVAGVTPPPKARVDDAVTAPAGEPAGGTRETFERRRDYLAGFLDQQPAADDPDAPGGELYEAVIAALRDIYDPEIPVNIYELGLIYGVEIAAGGHVAISMTLTTPNCPVAESMPAEVELRVGAVPGVSVADVNLVWDPPWDPAKMSDEARLELGML